MNFSSVLFSPTLRLGFYNPILPLLCAKLKFSTRRCRTPTELYMEPLKNAQKISIDTPEFHSLFTPELQILSSIFQILWHLNRKYQHELRIAGGAVRDLLIGKMPHDLDFATTATPQQMKEIFDKENIRTLNKRGEKHGTITCRLNDKENFEVTTLRIDKICDGRHAEVEFTTDWLQDANRRDLTVNSMFLGLDGKLYDFFGGAEDLKNRKIVFVGDAALRIQEDYLRILRYFRFFGRLSKSANDHDEKTIEAIKNNVRGLQGISGERLWVELKQIVTGRLAGPVVEKMFECGVAPYLGFPDTPNIAEFRRVVETCSNYAPKPMTIISGLFWTKEDALSMDFRMKVSNREKFLASFITEHRTNLPSVLGTTANDDDSSKKIEDHFKNLIIDLYGPAVRLENAEEFVLELIKYAGRFELLDLLKNWQAPKFPVDGVMLMHEGVRKGPAIRTVQFKLFNIWKESGCKAQVAELLANIDVAYKRENLKSPVPMKS